MITLRIIKSAFPEEGLGLGLPVLGAFPLGFPHQIPAPEFPSRRTTHQHQRFSAQMKDDLLSILRSAVDPGSPILPNIGNNGLNQMEFFGHWATPTAIRAELRLRFGRNNPSYKILY
jgi:hypothetical protein